MNKLFFIIILNSIATQAFTMNEFSSSGTQDINIADLNIIVTRPVVGNHIHTGFPRYNEVWPSTHDLNQLRRNRNNFNEEQKKVEESFNFLNEELNKVQNEISGMINGASDNVTENLIKAYNFIKSYEKMVLELFSALLKEEMNLEEAITKKQAQLKMLQKDATDIEKELNLKLSEHTIIPALQFIANLLDALKSNDNMLKYYLDATDVFWNRLDKKSKLKNNKASYYLKIIVPEEQK